MTKVQLHCPSSRATVDSFVISPYATNEQVLQGVRLAFNVKHATLYTIDAKPVTDVQSLQDDQRILVAAALDEHMLPDAPPGFVLYDGEEADDVDPDIDGYGQGWENLSDREKCEHIASLHAEKPTSRNKLRITRSYQSVHADLCVLTTGDIDTAEAESDIEQRWGLTYDHFLPASMAPPKFKVAGKIWDEKVVAALSVLSSFTHGQAHLVREMLEESVKMRIEEGEDASPVVQVRDVVSTVAVVYERAGVVPAKVTRMRHGKSGGRERRRALKERRKNGEKSEGLGSGSA